MKIRGYILIFLLSLLFGQNLFSQFTSKDNYIGDWTTSGTWVGGVAPDVTNISDDIYIHGNIKRVGDLVFDGGSLNVLAGDTLIVIGNITFQTVTGNDNTNTTDLSIETGAILIVFGSIDISNKVDVGNGGTLVVTENFTASGGQSEVTDVGDGETYIYGDVNIPNGQAGDFPSLQCPGPDPYSESGCSYGDSVDLEINNPGVSDIIQSGGHTITASGSTSIACGSSVDLTTTAGMTGYTWYKDNVVMAGETTNTIIVNQQGSYEVVIDDGTNTYTAGPVNITINNEPVVNDIADQNVCANYTLPVITGINLTGNQRFYTGAGGTGTSYSAGDVISSDITLYIYDETGTTPNCFSEESFSVTFDAQDPTITAPAAVSAVTDAGGCTASSVSLGTPVTSDNCNVASVTNNAPALFPLGATTVTWTVTDDAGNSATADQVVTVSDNISPTITLASSPSNVFVDGACSASLPDLSGLVNVSDNCSPGASIVITQSPAAGTPVSPGITTVTVTAEDETGNTNSLDIDVQILDNIVPNAVCQNITVSLDASGNASITPDQIDNGSTDNCTAASILSLTLDKSTFTCSDIGTNNVILTVRDEAGNTSTCTAIVTVEDNTNPVVNTRNITLTLDDATGTATLNASDVNNGSYDNCGINTMSVAPNSFDCSDVGGQVVTLTVTDANGNSNSSTATVTVESGLSIDNLTVEDCGSFIVGQFTSTVSGGSGSYSYYWDATSTGVIPFITNWFIIFPIGFDDETTIPSPYYWPVAQGSYTVNLTVTDGNGCSVNRDLTFISGPGGLENRVDYTGEVCENETVTYTAQNVGGATYNWTVTNGTITSATNVNPVTVAWDQGSGGGTIEAQINDNNCIMIEHTDVTINAAPAPSFTSPFTSVCPTEEVTYTLSSTFSSYSWTVAGGNITAGGGSADNTVTVEWGTGITGSVGVTVSNAGGCENTEIVNVSITDNVNPTISCPANVNVNLSSGSCVVSGVSLGTPTTGDNCGVQSVVNDAPTTYPYGATTVTWTVTDYAGNTNTCTQTVTVSDGINPTSVCKDTTLVLDCDGNASITAAELDGGSWDNCSITGITASQTTFDATNVGNNFITVTVTDTAGNTSQCTSIVTIVDNRPDITPGTNPIECTGTTTTGLEYTTTSGSPDLYSIDFDAAAEAEGFTDINNATLPASPISLAIPVAAQAGTYNANLTVTNSTLGCTSAVRAISITLNKTPDPGPMYRKPNN